jgi:S-adenosyl methyltransferase
MSDPTEPVPPGVDVSRPNVARMYDYWLGGTLNYQVDREAADRLTELDPVAMAPQTAWANRGFLQRAASWMAKQGVDQFLDFGAGLPTMNNTHDVVHQVDPSARIVYVDSDSEVVAHGVQLIGNVDDVYYIPGDVRRARQVLENPVVVQRIDFARPVGVLLVGLLYFVADPYGQVTELVEAVPAGSYLAISHATADNEDPKVVAQGVEIYKSASEQMYPRTRAEVGRFFDGLELVPPYAGAGPELCYIGQWGAEDPDAADDTPSRRMYAGVAEKPAAAAD